jgi:hypothetical protein
MTGPIVDSFSVEGATYQRRMVSCGKERCRKGCASGTPAHGPYWYAVKWSNTLQRTRSIYIGKHAPKLTTLMNRPEMKEDF